MKFSTNDFEFKNKTLYGFCTDLGLKTFPHDFEIKSAHTGKVVKFVADTDAAEDNEWWDGEMYQYRALADTPNCERVVLYPYSRAEVF